MKTLRFVCPSCTRDTDGIAAKLLRCGIASEALRRNMPLSSVRCYGLAVDPRSALRTLPTVLTERWCSACSSGKTAPAVPVLLRFLEECFRWFWFPSCFRQRIAKGAGGKGPRQKLSKSVKKLFDTFRQFSRRAKSVKNRQKVSKSFPTLFDNFRAAPFFRPLLGGSDSGFPKPVCLTVQVRECEPCTSVKMH